MERAAHHQRDNEKTLPQAAAADDFNLIDFDIVEESNVVNQGYWWSDAEQCRLKVEATSEASRRIGIDAVIDRYRPKTSVGNVVFCCVDSISARSAIWRTAKDACQF